MSYDGDWPVSGEIPEGPYEDGAKAYLNGLPKEPPSNVTGDDRELWLVGWEDERYIQEDQ